MAQLDARFGVVPRHYGEVTDSARLLRPRELRQIRRKLHWIHSRFPQVRVSVFAGLMQNRPARDYGYWLFNRCRFQESGKILGRCFSLLLLINGADATASLTAGYGFNGILNETDLSSAIATGVEDWKNNAFGAGVIKVLDALRETLKLAADRSEIGTVELDPLTVA